MTPSVTWKGHEWAELLVVRTCLTGTGIIFLISRDVRKKSGRKWKDLQQDDDRRGTVEN